MPARTRRRRAASARAAGTVVLRLDATIYNDEALRRANSAFAGLASIEIGREGRCAVVRFARVSPDIADRLPDEFANYALSCLQVAP